MGYKYSDPIYNPTYNYPWTSKYTPMSPKGQGAQTFQPRGLIGVAESCKARVFQEWRVATIILTVVICIYIYTHTYNNYDTYRHRSNDNDDGSKLGGLVLTAFGF